MWPRLFEKNNFSIIEKNVTHILRVAQQTAGIDPSDMPFLKAFLENHYMQYYLSFFINFLRFEIVYKLFDYILMKQDVRSATTLLIFYNSSFSSTAS